MHATCSDLNLWQMGALEILLSSGADAHASDLLGRTPLQVCLDGTSTIAPETWGGSVAVRNRHPVAAVSNSSYPTLSLGSREAVSALLSSAMKQSSTGDDASADAPLRHGGEGGMEGREGGDGGGLRGALEIRATLEKGQLHAVLTDEEKLQLVRARGGSRFPGGGLGGTKVTLASGDACYYDLLGVEKV